MICSGLLPGFAVGALEDAEVLRRETGAAFRRSCARVSTIR